MMLLVTKEDLYKLSPTCRQELLALLGLQDAQALADEMLVRQAEDEGTAMDDYEQQLESPTIDDVLEEKCVVDLTVQQAQELIANISPESQQTLRIFAPGAPVALDRLIGEDGPYRDFNHLKRSCVGAVNRRLRTVLGNRLAVLFSSDREKKRIKITPLAAASLRQVLNVPEPLPNFFFFDRESGALSPEESKAANILQERLKSAWHEFSGRPEDGRPSVDDAEVVKHFTNYGFEATTGTLVTWNEESDSQIYEFNSSETSAQLCARLEPSFLQEGDNEFAEIFLYHTEAPGILAKSHSVMLRRPINPELSANPYAREPLPQARYCVGILGKPCGVVIPAARAVNPSVSRCVKCQSEFEKTHDTRPYVDEGIAGTREAIKAQDSRLRVDAHYRGRGK